MRQSWRLGRRASTATALVYVIALVTYLLTLSRNSAASHDSITYINSIDSGEWAFHPHHLLYQPFCVVWLKVWRLLGLSADSSLIVAGLNSFFGAGIVAVVFSVLRRFFRHSTVSALSTTALVGGSFGVWFYSGCVEVYIIPLFLLMLALVCLLERPLSVRGVFMLGGLHGLAVLFHQAYVLVGFAVVARFYLTPRDFSLPRMRAFLLYLLPAASLVIGAYGAVLVWSVRAESAREALSWFTGYAHELPHAWHAPSVNTLLKAGIGFAHSFVGGQFVFVAGWLQDQMSRMLAGHELRDEVYLVRHLPSTVAMSLAALTALGAAVCVGLIAASFTSLKRIYAQERDALLPVIVWLAAFSLFFLVWEPSNLEFWIPQSVLVWLLLDRLWAYWAPRAPRAVTAWRVLLPVMLVVTNFVGGVYFLRSEANDYFYVRAQALAVHVRATDVVVTHEQWITEAYFKRFVQGSVFSPDDLFRSGEEIAPAIQRFVASIRAAFNQDGSVFCSFRPEAGDASVEIPPRFRAIWRQAVSDAVLDERPLLVGDEQYWVYRRR